MLYKVSHHRRKFSLSANRTGWQDLVLGGAPSNINCLKLNLGNIKTGGSELPSADIMEVRVVKLPLSWLFTCHTALMPFGAMTGMLSTAVMALTSSKLN